ncbi:I78 family peptidase inhibitor [Rhodalgimonas zhirmunskyi]|uniref:I78 family peptidase inhibitor n=1 Tax=Rhodalgimonas zhirmunskyi TaxID=2964767 RepID=A0AAJ1X721_9RHOB|nr:I78 family peptidase inhibitor [Rhodoalgimonas zhirmunskyi]MDQ2095794.1 I78 family peptidase inhibitor [Rhodoalgimonas zhirmunskyi]
MIRSPFALILAAPLALAACDTTNAPANAPRSAGKTVSNTDGVCAASSLAGFVGQPVNDVDLAGNDPLRIIAPGMAVTMDYSPERLNVETDANGVIVRFYCG